ncbi:phage distal tail protein, Rcc01695 family [Bosea sp. TAF32]|uniref:phage distal tail protein, Rcc01695 family n=1 Tax=Bosea sp. TAF32 TaxID=3237482 RepID=UPI003F8E63D0
MADFHEVRFPTDVARGARGGPERQTQIVTLASGREVRNSRWAHSRRRYDAGLGVRSFDALAAVVSFFEERRGRLHGFRWRDQLDWKSSPPSREPAATDQIIGIGDGVAAAFQLCKIYGAGPSAYSRAIAKPCEGTVQIALDGVEQPAESFACDTATGRITFAPGSIPPPGATVTAGFAFDVPVRFDVDAIDVDLSAFEAGEIPRIPVVEILP